MKESIHIVKNSLEQEIIKMSWINAEDTITDPDDFTREIRNRLGNHYGKECTVRLQKVTKNNGIVFTGISVLQPNIPITPTIYLESYFERYQRGEELSKLTEEMIAVIDRNQIANLGIADSFGNFEKIKGRIVYKLVGKDKNQKLSSDIPHVDYLDMMIVFYYLMEDSMLENATILIHNSHLEIWKKTINDLYEAAIINTPRLLRGTIQNMKDIMMDAYMDEIRRKGGNQEEEEKRAKEMIRFLFEGNRCPMYVLTNQKKFYGAACMLYDSLLENFCHQLGQNVYVLPSSVHEVILVPEKEVAETIQLKEMVVEINGSEVPEEDILTDSVYYYNYQKKLLTRCQ